MKKVLKDFDFWMSIVMIASAITLYCLVINSMRNEKDLQTDVKQLQTTIDSLKQECLFKDIDLGRYEYTIDQLEDTNPQAAKAFDDILSNAE
jgi:hypothetical protein